MASETPTRPVVHVIEVGRKDLENDLDRIQWPQLKKELEESGEFLIDPLHGHGRLNIY